MDKYKLSLRIKHTQRRHESIIDMLGLPAKFYHSVGDQRMTPKGRLLEGIYGVTYCSFTLLEKEKGDFVQGIEKGLETLSLKFDSLAMLSEEGADIGLFTEGNIGFSLSQDLMSKLSEFKIELSVEIYSE